MGYSIFKRIGIDEYFLTVVGNEICKKWQEAEYITGKYLYEDGEIELKIIHNTDFKTKFKKAADKEYAKAMNKFEDKKDLLGKARL